MKARDRRGVKWMYLNISAKITKEYEVKENIRRQIVEKNR